MEETKYNLVLVTHHSNGKLSAKTKLRDATLEEATARRTSLINRAAVSGLGKPDYRIVDRAGLQEIYEEIDKNAAKRVKAGQQRAAATRARRVEKGEKPKAPTFVLCPTCNARSKKLFSEFGGLQTRKCQNGHRFTHDKWIADRPFAAIGAALSGTPISRPL